MSQSNLRKRTHGSLSSSEEQPGPRGNPAQAKEEMRFRAMCEVFKDASRYRNQSDEHKRDTVCWLNQRNM